MGTYQSSTAYFANCLSSDHNSYKMSLIDPNGKKSKALATCPAGMTKKGTMKLMYSKRMLTCMTDKNKVYYTGGDVCPPEAHTATVSESVTPFQTELFSDLVTVGKKGVILKQDSDKEVGSAILLLNENFDPSLNINITDPSIKEKIDIQLENLSDWSIGSNGLVMRGRQVTEKGKKLEGKVTVNFIGSQAGGFFTLLIEVRELKEREGVECKRELVSISLISDFIVPQP